MKYECGIIKDLIPLYVDDVCGEESRDAVETHIEKCEKCKKYYENMKDTNGFCEKEKGIYEETKMKDSLKKVRSKINKKIRNIIICTVAVALFLTASFQLLFNVPIKKLDKDDVTVTAEVYPKNELPHSLKTDNESVEITFGENDKSDVYRVEIPSMSGSEINVSEDVIEKNGYVTVITTTSNYFLRSINWKIKDDTVYISSFKTTFLNNKAKEYQKSMTTLEFSEINKIVFVEKGKNTVLWERKK